MDVDEEHRIFGSLCCSFYGREVSNRFLLDELDTRAGKVMVTALSELWGGSFVDACNNDIRGELEGV